MSTNKIILTVTIVCAGLIAALFIFHLQNKPKNRVIMTDDVRTFAVPKELKSFSLTAENSQKFTERDLLNHWTILFFGFTHCTSVCPTTLSLLSRVYEPLQKSYPNFNVVLISLDPERDTPSALASYVRKFNPTFRGLTGSIQDIRKLQSQFGIFSSQEEGVTGGNYQLIHTSSMMLINPEGQWVGIMKYGMNPQDFEKGFKDSIRVLS